MNRFLRCVVSIGVALLATLALAAPPQTINYQGYLTNAGGTPVNSTVGMTFKFYNAASAGALLHTESQPSVIVTNGNFNVLLGSPTPIPLPFDVPYWLTVTITGDPEMSPRQPLASTPYSFRAAALDSAATIAGPQLTGSITTATIPVANVIGAVAGPTGPAGPQGAAGPAGATGPAGPNDITGNLTMVNSTNSAGNIMKGLVPFIHNFGISNTFVGSNAGNLVMTGFNNAANGTNALKNNSGGRSNTASGSGALQGNTTGDGNTASGANALAGNTIGSNNTASGSGALAKFTTVGSDNNSAFGVAALANAEGTNNTAIGFQAGNALSSGGFNLYLANLGAFAESNTTRIGSAQTRTFIAGIRSVTPAVNDALPVVIDSMGQLGTGVASGGTVTSVATGAGLSGGPITTSGTIALAATNLLPTTACATNQIPKWNGSAWACSADGNSGGTVTSVTAGTGLTGGSITTTGTIGLTATNLLPACASTQIPKWSGSAWACAADDNSLPGGAAGQVLQATAGAPVWTASPSITGNLTMVNSTFSTGNIIKGSELFIHNIGTNNTALGVNALASNALGSGNTANGTGALQLNVGNGNSAFGLVALQNNDSGSNNTAIGFQAGNALTTGSSNLYLANPGVAVESTTTRIGSAQTRAFVAGIRGVTPAVADALPVTIDSAGQLGTGGATNLALSGALNFGTTARQMLNLYSTQYAIGVQDFTVYQRSSDHFAWYQGGTHINTILTPGGTGATLMTLTTSPPPGGLPAVTGTVRAQVFTATSDRNVKEAFTAVDGAKVLAALVRMPLQSWKYRNEDTAVRHIGPTAQDFRAAFSVGYDDKTIATVDADGVAMAAIQGLNQKLEAELRAKDERSNQQEAQIKRQDSRILQLENALIAIQTMLGAR